MKTEIVLKAEKSGGGGVFKAYPFQEKYKTTISFIQIIFCQSY